MKNKLTGVCEFTFIRGGIAKTGKPYLSVSNGKKELFVDFSKEVKEQINEQTFEAYAEDDIIELKVTCTPGSDRVLLVSLKK